MGEIGDQPLDELQGSNILVRFKREEVREYGVSATGRHRGIRSVFEGNVECILEEPVYRKVHKL